MTSPDILRLRRLAALGDAVAAAELIRWRERQGEAWCAQPHDIPQPKLTDPPEVRDAAMFAWAERHIRAHGAVFIRAWRNFAVRGCVYYAASVRVQGLRSIVALLLDEDGPCALGRAEDRPPGTHCAEPGWIRLCAWHGTCAGRGGALFFLRPQDTCAAPTFTPCAT